MKKRGKRCRIFSNFKSQISIFVLIGIIILMGGLLYFFYEREFAPEKAEFVQPEIVPINLYIENCLGDVAENGLETIGLTGGFAKIPESTGKNPRAYLTALPGIGFKIPYWWYDGITAIPTEEFIKQQLKNHIQAELKNCVNNFEALKDRYEINQLKEPSAEVKFNEDDVSVNLNYQLEVISKDGSFKALIENFAYTSPTRFKKVHELAKLIMERENKDYFLERRTIDLYSMSKEIPTTDISADCKTKIWRLSEIKDRLMNLLRVNLPYIRIKGTAYNPNLYVPNPDGRDVYSDSYFQHHYIWEVDNTDKYKNMKIAFNYENWPMEIYARPSQNGILKSDSQKGAQMLRFLCLHIWHFTYDIKYPIVVTLIDQAAKNNKQYQFSFAFKVDIDHNQPNRASKGTALFETLPDLSSEEYCNDVQNEITIFTVNNATGEDLRFVNLTFVCGRYYCDAGQSEYLSLGAASGITKRLPYCVLGVIKGAKEGFADAQEFVQTDVDGRSYILLMNPVKDIQNYKVVKHLLSSPNSVQELSQNEKASIFIKGQDNSYETFLTYPQESGFELQLPAGRDATYEVTIYIIDDEDIVAGYVGAWKVSKDELANAKEVIFHVIAQGAASEDERALFVAGLDSYSKNVPSPELT